MKLITRQAQVKDPVDEVPGPVVQAPSDAIIRVRTPGLRSSDLHLLTVLGPSSVRDTCSGMSRRASWRR